MRWNASESRRSCRHTLQLPRPGPDVPVLDQTAGRPAVVVPCLNRYDLSFDCVRSVRQTVPEALLIVVDNGSTDATQILDADVMIRNAQNEGFSAACNTGAEAAAAHGCDPIVFLNNDTIVLPGWYASLARALRLPHVAAAGCRLVYPDGSIQATGISLGRTADDELWAYLRKDDAASGFVASLVGACMAVRRSAFEAAGGFDTGYWNGYEDIDLCLTLWKAGHKVAYSASGTIIHVESASGPQRFAAHDDNVRRLRRRWDGWCGTAEICLAGFPPPRDTAGGVPPSP